MCDAAACAPGSTVLDCDGGAAVISTLRSSADAAVSAAALSPTTITIRLKVHPFITPLPQTDLVASDTRAANSLAVAMNRPDVRRWQRTRCRRIDTGPSVSARDWRLVS